MSIQESDNLWNPEQPDGPEKEGLRWDDSRFDPVVWIGGAEWTLSRSDPYWELWPDFDYIVKTNAPMSLEEAKKWAQAEIHRWSMEIARATRPRSGSLKGRQGDARDD